MTTSATKAANRAKLLEQCDRSISDFSQRVLPLDYQQRGILLSEGLAFCAMCDLFEIEMLVESGVAGGRSTEIWARYFNRDIYAVDSCELYGETLFEGTRKRLGSYSNVKLIMGDSFVAIPQLLRSVGRQLRTALFIDGPKGPRAMELAEACFKGPSPPLFVGIHDMCKQFDDHLMDQWPSTFFYTDDLVFQETYRYLDELDRAATTADGRVVGEAYPFGPTVGFALNPFLSAQGPGLLVSRSGSLE
jgi:hypothetical protein